MDTSLLKELQGTWLLVSMIYKNAKGETLDLYGKDPVGILMYDTYGFMNAQMGFCNRLHFANEALSMGSACENNEAYKSYLSYFGRYREDSPGIIIHQVQGCMFPNWEGKEILRFAAIKSGLLVLSTLPVLFGEGEIVIEAVWRRA